jgi:hypothetical protein
LINFAAVRRIAVAIILFTMTLHCASRIGFLSFLYEQRHEIAYGLGWIDEVPIATCNGDYHFGNELLIQDHEDTHGTPPGISQAREITLFFNNIEFEIRPRRMLLTEGHLTHVVEHQYPSPPLSVFHPPS